MGRKGSIVALAAVTMMFGVAACGSESNTTSTADSGGGGATSEQASGGQAEAQARFKEETAKPTSVGIDTPLSKAPAPGKTIAIMNCGSPSCTAFAEAGEEAVKAAGWTPRMVNQGTDPQKIGAAWNQVARSDADGVINIGIPRVAVANQLKQLEAKNIPVATAAVADEPGGAIVGVLQGVDPAHEIGATQADAVVADVGDKANVLYHTTPEFPITSEFQKGFIERMGELCPSCKVEKLEISAAGAATGENVTKIVGFLRSHPDVNYVVGNDGVMVGLPNALKSAGLADKVRIVGQSSGPTQFAYLKANDGAYKATSYFAPDETAWRAVDILARQFNGDSLEPTKTPVPYMMLTADNLPSDISQYFPIVDGYQDQFKKLWKMQG
jgi:ribose transport system substrate-binding protein